MSSLQWISRARLASAQLLQQLCSHVQPVYTFLTPVKRRYNRRGRARLHDARCKKCKLRGVNRQPQCMQKHLQWI